MLKTAKMTWHKISPNLFLLAGLAIILGFSMFSVARSDNAVHTATAARKKADAILTITVQQLNHKLCSLSIPSWDARNELIHEVNAPVTVVEGADRILTAQIQHNNLLKAARLQKDLLLNGSRPKPC